MKLTTVYKALAFVLLLLVSFEVRSIIFSGVPPANLGSAPPLAGSISQSLGFLPGSNSLPVYGKDYKLQNTHYFYNKQWAVTLVVPTKSNADSPTVVLKRVNSLYQVVLGPGTAFSSSSITSLPVNVSSFLNTEGVIYEPVP